VAYARLLIELKLLTRQLRLLTERTKDLSMFPGTLIIMAKRIIIKITQIYEKCA